MIILGKYKLMLKCLGFNPLGGIESILVRLIYLTTMLLSGFMIYMNFILGTNDGLYQAMIALPALFINFTIVATYLHLLGSHDRLHSLISEFQIIVNESK